MRRDRATDIEVPYPTEGFSHLMREPELGRILGDIEVNDPSAVVTDDDQAVEQPERRGRNDEHVDGHGVAHVVAQEAAPGRGGDLGPPGYVSADGGLAHNDTELEQFAVDAGRAPEGIGRAYLADQSTDFRARLGPSLTAGS
jgi:hypothetical protein